MIRVLWLVGCAALLAGCGFAEAKARKCHELLERARTTADTLLVLTSSPDIARGSTCLSWLDLEQKAEKP